MRYRPNTLEEAFELADRLDYESEDGGPSVEGCPDCNEHLFVAEGYGPDGVTAYGYCLNPACGFERPKDEAADEAFAARVFRES